MSNIAIIFDIDGTLIDNNEYHKETWKLFCSKYNCDITDKEFKEFFLGNTNDRIIRYIFGEDTTQEQIKEYATEKEALYRQIYAPHIVPIKGIYELLREFKTNNIKCGVGSSAPPENVAFSIEKTNTKEYFSAVIDESKVTNGKPDPEIFLKAASLMQTEPQNCLVFEDSPIGIEAARNAGMKVIGITTTHSKEELSKLVDYVIDDYTQINIAKIKSIMNNKKILT